MAPPRAPKVIAWAVMLAVATWMSLVSCGGRTGLPIAATNSTSDDGGGRDAPIDTSGDAIGDGPLDVNTDAPLMYSDGGYTPPKPFFAAGLRHVCMVLATGGVACWGLNNQGQLGDGNTATSDVPVQVPGVHDAIAVAAGRLHTCALIKDGTILCWGRDEFGELGDGMSSETAFSPVPVQVVGITDAVAISAGGIETCAVHKTGRVSCWGDNTYGQIGLGQRTPQNVNVPTDVVGMSNAVAIAVGGFHACALDMQGNLSCWGANVQGELCDPTIIYAYSANAATSVTNGVQLAAGDDHTCIVQSTGTVVCCGDGGVGELGGGLNISSEDPVPVVGLTDAVYVSAGQQHTCAIRKSGGVQCWGQNSSGELGVGYKSQFLASPGTVMGISDFVISVATGDAFSCALLNGGVMCWGSDSDGQLGNGAMGGGSNTPVPVVGL